jgi:hypothetical protein
VSLPSLLVTIRRRTAVFLVREWGSESIHSIVYKFHDQQTNYPTISGGAHEIDRLCIQDGVRAEGDNILTHTNVRPFSYRICLNGKSCAYLHRGHDRFDLFRIEFQYAVQNADLVIAQWFFTRAVEL